MIRFFPGFIVDADSISLPVIFFWAISLVETEQMIFQYQAIWLIHLFYSRNLFLP